MKIIPIILLSLVFSINIVKAQEDEKSNSQDLDRFLNLSLEEMMNIKVITATQSLQSSDDAPATVRVITMEQIQVRGYRNLAEILNDLPDFTVFDKSDPQAFNLVGLRGVQRQDYFVILLDGIRISSPTNEPLPLLENFPIHLAKQIEVVYGPGSALYGADAMAGVINIITQKATDGTNVTATVMGGSQGYSNSSAIFNKMLKNDVRLTFSGLYSYDAQPDFSRIYKDQYSMNSHRTGVFNSLYGPMTPSGAIQPEFAAPIKAYNLYSSIDKGGFSMKFLHHYVSVPTSTTLHPDNAVYNKNVFYGHGMTTGSAKYIFDIGKLKSISTMVGSFYAVNPKSNYRNLYGGMEHGYKYSTGSMIKAEEQLNYSMSPKLNFIGGITYEYFESVPKTPELQSPVSRNSKSNGILLNSASENNLSGIQVKLFPLYYSNIGSYFQTQYFPMDKLSFTAGVRYDHNSRFGSTINPRIGAVFYPLEKTTMKVLYGTAFWAPSPMVSFESYGSFYTEDSGTTYRSTFWHLPNPDLKPMISQNFEVSIHQKIGKYFNVMVAGYNAQIKNVIHSVSDNGNTNLYNNNFQGWDVDYIEVPFNKGKQRNYGGSITVNSIFSVGRVELFTYSSYSYLQGKVHQTNFSEEEVEQGAIIPSQFRLGVDGKLKLFHFSVRLLQTGQQRMMKFVSESNNKRQNIDGYSLINLSTGYTFKEKVTFFVNVQNALNKKYINTLMWDSQDSAGSFQNPLRILAGARTRF